MKFKLFGMIWDMEGPALFVWGILGGALFAGHMAAGMGGRWWWFGAFTVGSLVWAWVTHTVTTQRAKRMRNGPTPAVRSAMRGADAMQLLADLFGVQTDELVRIRVDAELDDVCRVHAEYLGRTVECDASVTEDREAATRHYRVTIESTDDRARVQELKDGLHDVINIAGLSLNAASDAGADVTHQLEELAEYRKLLDKGNE